MKWQKLVAVALRSLTRNRMRSLLTMLGIIIGVGSVIALVALGEGSQADIAAEIDSMGTNLIIVVPESADSHGVRGAAGSSTSLSLEDADAIRAEALAVANVSAEIRLSEQVVAGNSNWNTSVQGVSQTFPLIRNYAVVRGSFFSLRDVKAKAKLAVLGQTVVDKLFAGQNPVGQRIRIRNVPFKVIGVLGEKGQNGMGDDQDDVILVPAPTALYRLSDGKTVRGILVSASTPAEVEAAKAQVRAVLRKTHGLRDEQPDDFALREQSEITAMASQVTGALTLLLSAIAGVSLLVGGIGVMNIMLVSVTERTREIGIRLAIGARSGDVLLQFLIEAVILCLCGGLIGIVVGLGAAFSLGQMMGTAVVANPAVILLSVGFTLVVGVFFGFYPARKAANLNPIEALRYE
ncbi:ABC transporter, membrane protein [Syntrophotalea carbinolica DSM 2380]|uniref:ABC transporter, membrane protein n=1 Tax=Syntrophotalea carbinolica (strain DSM 2380 / NBRC 103641 / GraBd1) TaxID=338963 RepID=Q3A7L7_SYNC1|nr:ABC transporter permease [Syntrophotalea carbinolica]ABA87627.1 ABC transporter, membrane protein [Syntrophotalea carbinolica DSM 2380]